MSVCDYYLSRTDGETLKNAARAVGNLLQASRLKATAEWQSHIESFYPQPADLAAMPDGSWLLRIEFLLRKPYTSRAEGEFRPSDGSHELQNPIVRDHLTGLPMVRPTTWKGHLALAARLLGLDRCDRLFGSALGSERGQEGRLHFFPSFFLDKPGREVVTPLSRETRTPVRGPIDFEVVTSGSSGSLHLLYVPRPKVSNWTLIGDDLKDAARAVKSMLLEYGFSAKKTSGWGIVRDTVQSGRLFAKGAAWPPVASANARETCFVEPSAALVKFMDESGVPDSRLKKASGEWLSNPEFKSAGAALGSLTEYKKFRAWHDAHGAEWKRRRISQQKPGTTVLREYSFDRVSAFASNAEALADALRQVPRV